MCKIGLIETLKEVQKTATKMVQSCSRLSYSDRLLKIFKYSHIKIQEVQKHTTTAKLFVYVAHWHSAR